MYEKYRYTNYDKINEDPPLPIRNTFHEEFLM
jgi:hypothetical protein